MDRIRADGYGFQIEMTYEAKRAGAEVVEVPIRFVDRVDGESKMSAFIVVEALGLVTWWGLLRAVETLRGRAQRRPGRELAPMNGPGRILVADDEPYITDVVTAALRFEGFASEEASTGSEALEKAREGMCDLIVLDVMLPDIDGFEVCRRLRDENVLTPVLFLTARDATADKLAGLVHGDDYVTKPFSIDELVARIRAVLRRTALDDHAGEGRLTFSDLVIDVSTHEVWRADQPIDLTATEFNLLHFLIRNARQVLVQGPDPRRRVDRRFHRRLQHRGDLHLLPAQEDRPLRPPVDPHHPAGGVQPP